MFHAASYQKFSGVAPFLLYSPGEGMSVVVTQTSLSWSRTSWGPRTVVHKRVYSIYRPLVGLSNWYFNAISRRFRSRLRSDITYIYIYIYIYKKRIFFGCQYVSTYIKSSPPALLQLLRLLLYGFCWSIAAWVRAYPSKTSQNRVAVQLSVASPTARTHILKP